jgi:hypothetical protein
MCMCIPPPAQNRSSGNTSGLEQKEPGAVKLLIAGIVFFSVLAFSAIGSLWQRHTTK